MKSEWAIERAERETEASNVTRVQRTLVRLIVLFLLALPFLWVGYWLALFWPTMEDSISMYSPSVIKGQLLFRTDFYGGRNHETELDRYRTVDLSTGQLRAITRDQRHNELSTKPGYEIYPSRNSRAFNADSANVWDVYHTDANGATRCFQLEQSNYPRLFREHYVVTATKDKLIVVDLEAPQLPPVEVAADVANDLVLPLPDSNYVVVYKLARKTVPQVYPVDVYCFNGHSVQKVASWPSSQVNRIFRINGQLLIMVINASGVQELRSLEDGSEIQIEIDSNIDLTQSQWQLLDPWNAKSDRVQKSVLEVHTPERNRFFEVGSWKELPSPSDATLTKLWIRDKDRNQLVYSSPDMKKIECIDELTGATIWARDNPIWKQGQPFNLKALDSGQVLIHGFYSNPDLAILAQSTGATQKVFRPLRYISYVLTGWSLYLCAWVYLWIGWSVRDGGWAWLDCTLLLVFAILAITVRVQISSDPHAVTRLEFRIAQGFCVAGLSFASVWLVFGRTRWTLKILPPFFIVAFICATITYIFGIGSWATAETLAGLLAFTTWMTLIGWIANLVGFRLIKNTLDSADAARINERRRKHFPLRDIFVITVAVAIFFAVIRFVPLHQIQVWSWGALEVIVYSLLLSIHVLCAIGCALSSHARWARIAIWLGVATLMPLAGIAFQAKLHRTANYLSIAEFHISVHTAATIAVFSLMHVYRWRGWRFQLGGYSMRPTVCSQKT